MSNIVTLSIVLAGATLLGAAAGYLIARRRCQAWAKTCPPSSPWRPNRLVLNLLGSIVGGLISSISSYVMMALGVPDMLIEWLSRMLGA